MKISCIYWILNMHTSKVYVGRTNDYFSRKVHHKSMLRGGYHSNKHLQSAWNKCSEDAFVFQIVEICDKDMLVEREHYWATRLNSHNPIYGYNIADTLYQPSGMSDKNHTNETRNKISRSKRDSKSHKTYEERVHLKSFKTIRLIQITDLEDNILYTCILAEEASKYTGIKLSAVYNQLCGIAKVSRKGFKIRYKDNN